MVNAKRFFPFVFALGLAVATTMWFTSNMPTRGPKLDKPAATQTEQPDIELGAALDGNSAPGDSARSAQGTPVPAVVASIEQRYMQSDDLYSYYQEMMALSAAGDAEATYHAALALHECWLANTRTNGWACHADASKSQDVLQLCTQMQSRCEGFADRTGEWITTEREALYEEAAAAGFERGVARGLIALADSDPELALSLSRDLLASTEDFGTLFHVGRYLQNRLWRNHEGWIGGEWNETTNRPGPSSRYGQAAWQLAACDLNQGCPNDSVFMRSLCVTGNGCQAGWSYLDWLAYYRSPYEFEQITALTQEIRDALAAGDIDSIINRGREQPPTDESN